MRIATLLLLMTLLPAATLATEPVQSPLFVVHFQTGPNWDDALAPSEQDVFREHSANLRRLRKAGVIAFGARYSDVGMIFVEADSLASAAALMDEDPGVRAGIFDYRIAPLKVFYPWRE